MNKPFKIRLDPSRSLRAAVRDVIAQAMERQKKSRCILGAVLQHLVGANLDCALDKGHLDHTSFSIADSQGARAADFFLGDVAIHVTTSPSEALIEGCRENINDGFRPIVVTLQRCVPVAEGLADYVALADRIDIFGMEQFVALNLYQRTRFGAQGRKTAVAKLVNRYNEIVAQVETDPSLKIDLVQ